MILEVATILGVFLALAVARAEYADVRRLLAQAAPHSPWLTVIAYLIVVAIVWGAVMLLARRIRGVIRMLRLGLPDRLGGAAIGLLQGAIVIELLIYLAQHVHDRNLSQLVHNSTLAGAFTQVVPYLHQLFPQIPR